jgi:hypothetical protein
MRNKHRCFRPILGVGDKALRAMRCPTAKICNPEFILMAHFNNNDVAMQNLAVFGRNERAAGLPTKFPLFAVGTIQ